MMSIATPFVWYRTALLALMRARFHTGHPQRRASPTPRRCVACPLRSQEVAVAQVNGLCVGSRPISRILSPPHNQCAAGGDHLSGADVSVDLGAAYLVLGGQPANAPTWPCSGRGMPGRRRRRRRRCALTAPFQPHRYRGCAAAPGGLLSVALFHASPRLGVTQRPALWSPDFPRRRAQPVSYTHLRAHETDSYLVCRLLLEK